MVDSPKRKALMEAIIQDTTNKGVAFSFPKRKNGVLFNLKEEVDFKKKQEPTFVEAVCGIVGQVNTGRKYLADRFGRMNEQDIDSLTNDQQLCYSCNFDTIVNGRPIRAVIKAYIIPPPYVNKNHPVPLYVRASRQFCCLLFAFDVTERKSFNIAQSCIRKMNICLPDKYFLVGNKCDLRGTDSSKNEVSKDEAKTRAGQVGAICYFECSAKRNINVKPIMETIVRCECDCPHV